MFILLPEPLEARGRFPGMTITCALIQMVEKMAEKTGKAKISTKARVTELIMSDGACTGCIYEMGGATFKEFGPRDFQQRRCPMRFQLPLQKPKDRIFALLIVPSTASDLQD